MTIIYFQWKEIYIVYLQHTQRKRETNQSMAEEQQNKTVAEGLTQPLTEAQK